MLRHRTDITVCLVLFVLCLMVFSSGLSVHGLEYRDDEIFYYKSTQEMTLTGDIWSPKYFGEDRFQKPILFYWLVLLSYKIFGVSWFGARFTAVLFAALTVCATWGIGRILFNRRVAALAGLILMTIPLFFRHAKNVVPDMVLNFFVVAAMLCLVIYLRDGHRLMGQSQADKNSANKFAALFFLSCALGFMVKGFIAFIVPIAVLLIIGIAQRNRKIITGISLIRGALLSLLIIGPWFAYMIAVHGSSYLDYMLVDETKNRLIASGGENALITVAKTFLDHSIYYLGVIGSYFAPWSLFMAVALPLALCRLRKNDAESQSLGLLIAWIAVVYFFFSSIYFSINHYMLVLSAPFALIVSWFFCSDLDLSSVYGKIISVVRSVFPVIIFTVCLAAYCFLSVFLAGTAKWWLLIFALLYLATIFIVIRSRNQLAAPISLGLIIVAVFSQSSIMDRAGITSHSVLQKFAATAQDITARNLETPIAIGVGSHDIHEKEFQVYFEQKVLKSANSNADESDAQLRSLFSDNSRVLCLIIAKDFERYRANASPGTYETVQEEYIFRRRMYLDAGFFSAVLRLDQDAVKSYLKEKIILIEKT